LDVTTRSSCVQPRDPLESQLVEIWENLLGVKPIGVTDNFFDLNGNSLLASQLFTKVKQVCGRNLPLSTLFQAPTIERLADLLRTADSKRAWSSVVAIRPEGSKPPLFLISGLGGNVVRFRDLGRNLGLDQPVYALQPPGLDGEQAPLTRIEDMAAHYIREIRRVQPAGPYHFAGYSFGGLVMFEMAQQLSAQSQHVGLLALLDTPEWRYITELRRSAPFRNRLLTYQSRVHHLLFGPDRIGYLKRRLQKRAASLLYRMFRALGWPLWQTVGTLEDANSFAGRSYEAKPYDGKLTVLRGQWRTKYDGEDPELGWGRLAPRVDVYNIPGNHDSIMTEPHVRVLAEKLTLCLERANADATSAAIGAL
jgi:aspartate racemase